MDHLAQDLSVALEESESCGPIAFDDNANKWGMRRRTRSAGNLHLYNNSGDCHSDDSSSSSEIRRSQSKLASFHQSDSDELSFSLAVAKAMHHKTSVRMKHSLHSLFRGRCSKLGVNHGLESDSVNENSPARPSLRRKRKLKRMSIDETPIPPTGKRKRPQRLEMVDNGRFLRHARIRPLHQSLVDKIERFCQPSNSDDPNKMETQSMDECEFASESSISWSGGEGHEGDDELTDWAPSIDNTSVVDPCNSWTTDTDPREIRAGCRRLGPDERRSFTIHTGANERVAKFLQDTTKSELKIMGGEREKLGQLAALYSLDLWFEGSGSSLLKKTSKTPCMQPTQRHHSGLNAAHKRIRTQDHIIS